MSAPATVARAARAAVPLARRAVRTAAVGLDRVAPPQPGVVVLAYHQVGGAQPGPVNLPAAQFEEQIAHLVAAVDVVTLDEACDHLVSRSTAPGRAQVVVTFDDGTADFVEVAVPILVRHGVPATLYLATAFVEDGRSFWDDGTTLSWAALRDALSTGLVTVGSHTHEHVLLDRADAATAADDLDRSIGLLADRLGVEARHFAYPKALAPSAAVEAEVARRFRSAALAGSRANLAGRTDLHRLARTPVLVDDGPRWFARKATGGLRLEGTARASFDRLRHARAAR